MIRKRPLLSLVIAGVVLWCGTGSHVFSQAADSAAPGPDRVRRLVELAEEAYAAERYNDVVDYYQAALNLATEIEDKPLIAEVASSLASFISVTSYASYAVRYREIAAGIYRELNDSVAEVEQLLALGPIYLSQERYGMVSGAYDRVLQISRAVGDRSSENEALVGLAAACRGKGDVAGSRERCQDALKYYREVGDSARIADVLLSLAATESGAEGLDKAVSYRREAAQIYGRIGQQSRQAQTLLDLGLLWQANGQYDSSLVRLQQARSIFRKLGNDVSEVTILAYTCVSLYSAGNAVAFRDSLKAVARVLEETSDPYRRAWGAYFTATQLKTVSAWAPAGEMYGRAVLYNRETDDQQQAEALCLAEQGQCYVELGQIDSGLVLLNAALTLNRDIGETMQETMTLEYIGLAHAVVGRYDEALDYLGQAREIHQATGAITLEAVNLRFTGSIEAAAGRPDSALVYFQKALEIHDRVDYPTERIPLLISMADFYLSLGEPDQAREAARQAMTLADTRQMAKLRGEVSRLFDRIDRASSATER